MAEYIEREAALKILEKSLTFSETELDKGKFRDGCIAAIQDDIGNIRGIPTADVVPKSENVIVLPCKIGSTIYKIDKSCDINNGYKDEYKCSPEFDKNCEYFEDDYWEQPHFCKKIGSFEGDYCKFNLDIVCDNCKERLCVQKDIFDYGKIPQIFGTPFFDKNTNLYDTYFLTKEEAEKAIAELKKKYTEGEK